MKNSLAWLPLASGMLVLVLSLGLAFLTVATRNPASVSTGGTTTRAKAQEAVPSLILSPDSKIYDFAAGQTYPVGIIADSAGRALDGVDVVISFDPTKVQIIGDKINPTTVFQEFPLNKVDSKQGKIRFSGLTFNPTPVLGVIGTFSFKPLSAGEVNFSFDFTKGATTDSNMAEHGRAADILEKVVNANYTFK